MSGQVISCAGPVPQASVALAGVPQVTLQIWLTAAQAAMQALMTGQSIVNVQYAEGQGHRQVSYKAADRAMLQGWIMQLQNALGVRTRRAFRFGF